MQLRRALPWTVVFGFFFPLLLRGGVLHLSPEIHPRDLAVVSSRRVVILDELHNELVLMDTTGTILRRTGGYGGAPGRFRRPVALARNGLEIYLLDQDQLTVTRFNSGLARIYSLALADRLPLPADLDNVAWLSVFSNGETVLLDPQSRMLVRFEADGSAGEVLYEPGKATFQLGEPGGVATLLDQIWIWSGDDGLLRALDRRGYELLLYQLDPGKIRSLCVAGEKLLVLVGDDLLTLNPRTGGRDWRKLPALPAGPVAMDCREHLLFLLFPEKARLLWFGR